MLIQNATSSPVPAPRVSNDAGGMPVAGASVSRVDSPPVETPKVADKVAEKTAEKVQTAPAQQPTSEQLKDAMDILNKEMKQTNSELVFTIDKDTNKTVVRLVDLKTGDTIKQFPSEEVLAISRAIDRIQKGLLVKQQA
jgi:flagellar protein FlaG